MNNPEFFRQNLIGIFHFLAFYVWGLTLPVEASQVVGATSALVPVAQPMPPIQYFVIVLCFILFYDLFWMLLTKGLRSKTHYMLRIWTSVNTVTGLAVISAYVVLKYVFAVGQWWSEAAVTGIVFTASAIDITELVQNKGIFRRFLKSVIGQEDDPPPGSNGGVGGTPPPAGS